MTDTPQTSIDELLTQLRADATAAIERLRDHRDRAAEHTAAADAETRAYTAAYRDIRARGWFTPTQLRALGFPAPRSRPRRPKPSQ